MSRELKFRVWDNENKSYNDPYSCAYYALAQDGGLDFYCHGDHMGKADPDVYFIEQYTGLKDKNGKEIYEGDIVRCGTLEGRPAGVVVFRTDDGWYEVDDPLHVFGGEHFGKLYTDEMEVIGNIHENAELLG